jgi:hypothetical protein
MYLIIPYLLDIIQDQNKQISYLLHFICRFIPLKQWLFDDSHSPKYQRTAALQGLCYNLFSFG